MEIKIGGFNMERITFSEMMKTGKATISNIKEVRGRDTGTPLYKIETAENPGKYALVERWPIFQNMFLDFRRGIEVVITIDSTNSQPMGYTKRIN